MIRNNLVWPPRNGETLTPHELEQSAEQSDYLRGVLFADKHCRFAKRESAEEVIRDIGPYRVGMESFWRGVLDTAGSISMPSDMCEYLVQNPRQARPRLRMTGSYEFMNKFREFLEEELGRDYGGPVRARFDPTGSLAGDTWNLQGQMVQDIVRLLYGGCIIARESFARTADEIMAWQSRGR